VHVAARGAGPRALAGDLARVLGERLNAARSVREQVVAFALRAAPPGEARFAVDADGRLLAANPAGRRWLGPSGELPAHLAAPVRAAVVDAAAGAEGDRELLVETPGASAVRLAATLVRYERAALGAVLRVVEAGPRPAARGGAHASAPAARYALGQILGASRAVASALELARTAARNDLPVVVEGESGTGKELFAQAIHALSARAGGPFVAVNCGCIPETLVEAELFGYEPGTFTGGRREGNVGKFEKASRGTIFLDEVGELPAQAQAALLRVLQEREVVRLGGCAPRRIDIRVIAATNRSLAQDVRAGRFRADLYFRLAVLPITIPPLRDRREDVALLARAFLSEAEVELGRTGLALAEPALAALEAYAWPGNVRELRNVVLRTAATATASLIELADLPEELRVAGHAPASVAAPAPPFRTHGGGDSALDREALLAALDASGWNVARTAQALHVSRMTLYRWLTKHQIAR
jgi:transcriptional regulator with PAS, ATPase and Fis domain